MNETINQYHHFIRLLAFLAEQKIATGFQIEKYCFNGLSRSFAWKAIKKLRQSRLIDPLIILSPNSRPFSAYQLTNDGFKELKLQTGIDLEEIQIKSNSPQHDIALTDLRLLFSRIQECQYFISENVIRSKLLPDENNELAVFRSCRSDSAVRMTINKKDVWLALEYERSRKSLDRYVQRIKNWYQREDLPGILVATEDEPLAELMAKIDAKTIPQLPRKVLFFPKSRLHSATTEVKFINSQKEPLTFSLGKQRPQQYPILDQSFAKRDFI